jgi:hypothetical protein
MTTIILNSKLLSTRYNKNQSNLLQFIWKIRSKNSVLCTSEGVIYQSVSNNISLPNKASGAPSSSEVGLTQPQAVLRHISTTMRWT